MHMHDHDNVLKLKRLMVKRLMVKRCLFTVWDGDIMEYDSDRQGPNYINFVLFRFNSSFYHFMLFPCNIRSGV